jgi:hypothetical protein
MSLLARLCWPGSLHQKATLERPRRRIRPAASRRTALVVERLEARFVPATASTATMVACPDDAVAAANPSSDPLTILIQLEGTVSEITGTSGRTASFELSSTFDHGPVTGGTAEASFQMDKAITLKLGDGSAEVEIQLDGKFAIKPAGTSEEISFVLHESTDIIQKGSRGMASVDLHGLIELLRPDERSASPLASLDVEQKGSVQPEANESAASLRMENETSYKTTPRSWLVALQSSDSSALAMGATKDAIHAKKKAQADGSMVLSYLYPDHQNSTSITFGDSDNLTLEKKADAIDRQETLGFQGAVSDISVAATTELEDAKYTSTQQFSLLVQGPLDNYAYWAEHKLARFPTGAVTTTEDAHFLASSPGPGSVEAAPGSLTAHLDTYFALQQKKTGQVKAVRTQQEQTGATIAFDLSQVLYFGFPYIPGST